MGQWSNYGVKSALTGYSNARMNLYLCIKQLSCSIGSNRQFWFTSDSGEFKGMNSLMWYESSVKSPSSILKERKYIYITINEREKDLTMPIYCQTTHLVILTINSQKYKNKSDNISHFYTIYPIYSNVSLISTFFHPQSKFFTFFCWCKINFVP